MKTFPLFIALALLIGLIGPAVAQDEASPDLVCTMEDIAPMQENWPDEVDRFNAALESGDVQTLYDEMIAFDLAFEIIRSVCNPLQWEGDADVVIGPVVIEAGVYKAIFEAPNEIASVEITALGDGCRDDYLAVFKSDEAQRTEQVFQSQGCSILMEVDSGKPWTLRFDKMG